MKHLIALFALTGSLFSNQAVARSQIASLEFSKVVGGGFAPVVYQNSFRCKINSNSVIKESSNALGTIVDKKELKNFNREQLVSWTLDAIETESTEIGPLPMDAPTATISVTFAGKKYVLEGPDFTDLPGAEFKNQSEGAQNLVYLINRVCGH